MSQSAHPKLLDDVPEDEPWPPVPPDVQSKTLEIETPEFIVTGNSMLYKIKGHPDKIYKFRVYFREYQLHEAAVLTKVKIDNDRIWFNGFIMDLATPMVPVTVPPSQRRDVMHQMIQLVDQIHAKGIVHGDLKLENMLLDKEGRVRLTDFGEGRYMDEDESVWEGMSTWHFESPNRLLRGQQYGYDSPPPIFEDDLFGLGLSIWQLYTGKEPHDKLTGNDLGLKEKQLKGETVDVSEVQDEEAREIITNLLRKGGARI